jgi:hypothetical protein
MRDLTRYSHDCNNSQSRQRATAVDVDFARPIVGMLPAAPLIDPRLVFLEGAAARLVLVEACVLCLDDAFEGLLPAIYKFADCRCYREILESFDRWDDDHRSRRSRHHDHGDAADHGRADCGDGWLRGLVRAVATATEGDRNSILFWAACRGSEAVRDGKAAEGFVNNVLLEAAKRCGLGELEAKRTIQSGMRRT